MTTTEKPVTTGRSIPGWLSGLIPLLALLLMLGVFAFTNPLAMFQGNLPPIEALTFERVSVAADGFDVILFNGGPEPVTVAQVMVDDAYWQFAASPAATIPRFGRAVLSIPYPWVETEPNIIRVVTPTGATFDGEVGIATPTPRPGLREFLAYGLLGAYVGIVPVGLGLLWYPAMRRMGRKWLDVLLALTVGLLVFLLIDTLLEAFEVAALLPGAFQGVPLVLFTALLTWLALLAIGSRAGGAAGRRARGGLYVATMIAFSIGLHNFGEGLAIGAAFALGEAALGSFLVIGFTLHNITEGIGIAAPLVPRPNDPRPSPPLAVFVGLMLLAGSPAILGAWIGGFAFSPLLATICLGIGVGAIWQVVVEVTGLLRSSAEREGSPLFSWPNVLGFFAGLAIMYFTAFLVKF